MGRTDISYNSNVGLCCLAHIFNFTKTAHTHFKYSCLIVLIKLKHAHRHTDSRVEVARCFVKIELSVKHCGKKFLCCCFTNGAGYRNSFNINLTLYIFCDITDCANGVFYNDNCNALNVKGDSLSNNATAARFNYVGNI